MKINLEELFLLMIVEKIKLKKFNLPIERLLFWNIVLLKKEVVICIWFVNLKKKNQK